VKRRKHSVRLLRIAEEDFTAIVTYVAAHNPEAAEILAQRIEKNLMLLAGNPYLGRISERHKVDGTWLSLSGRPGLLDFLRCRRTHDLRAPNHPWGSRLWRIAMSPWRVTSVTVLPDVRLRVTFVDGTTGEVDMRAFLASSEVKGTIFEALRDPAVFAEARVVMGAIQWPNGADLAPDAIYDAIRKSGVWVLD
jgi:plasmid stabilization system protein ParE